MASKEIVGKHMYKASFIVSSTAQVEMFSPLTKELPNYHILAININKGSHKSEIERTLLNSNFCYETIDSLGQSETNRLLERTRPDIVVVGHDDTPMDRLFVKSANSIGIPTLLVQDGILGRDQDLLMKEDRGIGKISNCLKYLATSLARVPLFIERRDISWHQKCGLLWFELRHGSKWKGVSPGFGECLKMAAFGEATKKLWITEGIDSGRIVVTGNPKFDKVFNSKRDNCKEKICQRWGIPLDKEVVVLMTQYFVEAKIWSPEQRRSFVIAIANATAALPNTQLIIKLHPTRENEENYHEIVKNLSSHPIICKYAPFPELLNACSLAITVSSTSALEAMAVGKPVIIVNLFDNEGGASLYKGSGALHVENERDILSALQKALYDPQTRENMKISMDKFVNEQAYQQDGRASERIADLIRDMVSCK